MSRLRSWLIKNLQSGLLMSKPILFARGPPCGPALSNLIKWNKSKYTWGVWVVTQSVKHPAFAQVTVSWFESSSPVSGSASGDCLEFSAPFPVHTVSISPSQNMNKLEKNSNIHNMPIAITCAHTCICMHVYVMYTFLHNSILYPPALPSKKGCFCGSESFYARLSYPS